jgi:hypothetical protein
MKTIEELIQQLELFSSALIDLQPPIAEARILELEEKFGFQLPKDYKAFLRAHNGLTLMGVTVYGIHDEKFSLEKSYSFEHYEITPLLVLCRSLCAPASPTTEMKTTSRNFKLCLPSLPGIRNSLPLPTLNGS